MEEMIRFPIRILHILHSMNRGGTENAIMNYYRSVDRTVVQFDFLLTDSGNSDFEDEIKSLGGKIFRIPLLTMKSPGLYVKSVQRFFMSHPEYKIVHSHTSSKSAIPLAIAKYCKIPVRISHSHSSQSEKGARGLIRNALMPALKIAANAYFSCGEQAAQWLYGKTFSNSGKVQIVRNVITAEKFRYNPSVRQTVRDKLGIAEDAFVIGHVARFSEVKNHRFSVDILKEVLKRRPDTFLLLIGDGQLRDEIFGYAKQQGVESHVIMTGVVPNVYDYEQAMDAFILPSFYEGLPLSIVEAQVSGLPCFTTKGTVSSECSVTDLVKYIPLSDGASVWAEEILQSSAIARTDRFEEVKAAGYDAASAAIILQNRYVELYNSIGKQ